MHKATNSGNESLRDLLNVASHTPRSFAERGNVRLDQHGNPLPPPNEPIVSDKEDQKKSCVAIHQKKEPITNL